MNSDYPQIVSFQWGFCYKEKPAPQSVSLCINEMSDVQGIVVIWKKDFGSKVNGEAKAGIHSLTTCENFPLVLTPILTWSKILSPSTDEKVEAHGAR